MFVFMVSSVATSLFALGMFMVKMEFETISAPLS